MEAAAKKAQRDCGKSTWLAVMSATLVDAGYVVLADWCSTASPSCLNALSCLITQRLPPPLPT